MSCKTPGSEGRCEREFGIEQDNIRASALVAPDEADHSLPADTTTLEIVGDQRIDASRGQQCQVPMHDGANVRSLGANLGYTQRAGGVEIRFPVQNDRPRLLSEARDLRIAGYDKRTRDLP